MQARESDVWAQTPLDRLLARTDEAAHAWIAQRLIAGDAVEPAEAPPALAETSERLDDLVESEG
jgi:hypothetical protein